MALVASVASAADASSYAERESKIERASLRVDADALKVQVDHIDLDLAQNAQDPSLIYLRAFAHYEEGSIARAHKDKEQAQKHLEVAANLLEKIKGSAWEAEACGLRGYIYNQLIGINGMSAAMSLGPKSSALLEKAGEKAPDNPRVLFFRGVSLVTTPEMFGGDVAQGIDLLERATKKFENQPAEANVHWGQTEALAWLGIAKQKTGNVEGARTAWERALVVEPEYGWVKHVLLPSLDKAMPKKGK
jgi:tetratricopeptide (TPR) repeat protein